MADRSTKWNGGWWGVMSWASLMAVTLYRGDQITIAVIAAVLLGMSLGRVTWSRG
jgi:hypothetical protein